MTKVVGVIALAAALAITISCPKPPAETSAQPGQPDVAPPAGEQPAGAATGEAAKRAEAPPPPPPPREASFADGTSLVVRTTTTLSTKSVKSGERFVASLEEPLVSGDWVVARKGAQVEGTVADSDPGGRVSGVASITVKLTELTTNDGQSIAITTSSVARQAKKTVKKDAVRTGVASGVGAAIGAIAGGGKGAAIGAGAGAGAGAGVALATHGDPAVIPAETVLRFRLSAPVVITEKK